MKNPINISIFFAIILINFISCTKKFGLNEVENDQIKLEQYRISEITSVHEFIDMTNKRWNITERIYEGNNGQIDSLFIRNDSVIIAIRDKYPVIYDLASIKFSYKIAVMSENEIIVD